MSLSLSWLRFFIQSNYSSLVLFIALIVFVCTNRSFSKTLSLQFIFVAITDLLLTISDNCRYFSYHLTNPTTLRYISAAAGYTLRPLVLYFLAIISGRYYKANVKFLMVPCIVNGIFAFLSCFGATKGIMFFFDATNNFHRGILSILPYITCLIYVIVIFINSYRVAYVNPFETVIVTVVFIFALFATYMESQYKFDLLLSQTLGVTIVIYYMFLNIQMYKRDELTQLFDRRALSIDLNRYNAKKCTYVSMDVNNLKEINDKKGHLAGDEALKEIALIMKKSFRQNATLYRVGGDEFLAVVKHKSKVNPQSLVKAFQRNLAETKYMVACGCAEYQPGDSIEDVFECADQEMYKNKKFLKS